MDELDLNIIRLLHARGRLSHEQIAQQINLSRPAVHERIRRMETQEVIRSYTAIVNWGAVGQPIGAFIWVRTSGVQCNETGQAIIGLSNDEAVVESCHRVTGEWCMLLKTRAASTQALQDLIDCIRKIPGVQATMTSIVLSELSEIHCDTPQKEDS